MNRSAIVAALAAAALLGSTPPALAAPPRHSSIFAGYEVSKPTAHLRNVTATFVVPRISCEHEFGGVGTAVLVYSHVNPRTGAHRTSGGGVGVASQTFVGDSSVTVNGVSGELNPFSKTHATGVRIDGRPLAKNHPHRYVWARDGKTLVTASALTAGENFTLTFRSGG